MKDEKALLKVLFLPSGALVHLLENNLCFFGHHLVLICQLFMFVGVFPQQLIMTDGGLELQTKE